jgi:hypothetical protein
MNSRKITKYVVLIFTILLADIIKEIVLHLIGLERDHRSPYLSAAIGMGVIVLVFYPMFTIMEKILESITHSYVTKTKNVTGGSYKGLIVAFILGVAVLYFAYLKVWFNINIFAKLL